MSSIIDIVSGTILLIGSIFIFLSAAGLLKMPDFYMRTSVVTKSATLGVGLVLLGTSVFFHEVGVYARAALIIIFVYMTAPVASHIIGRAAFLDKVPLWKGTQFNHLEGKYSLDENYLKSPDEAEDDLSKK